VIALTLRSSGPALSSANWRPRRQRYVSSSVYHQQYSSLPRTCGKGTSHAKMSFSKLAYQGTVEVPWMRFDSEDKEASDSQCSFSFRACLVCVTSPEVATQTERRDQPGFASLPRRSSGHIREANYCSCMRQSLARPEQPRGMLRTRLMKEALERELLMQSIAEALEVGSHQSPLTTV